MDGAISLAGGKVRALVGDITRVEVDAIVNAANSGLMGGGGVDGAIHAAGGPVVTDACRTLRMTGYPDGLPVGSAVSTPAGRLPAKHVIHTVGPAWKGGSNGEDDLLASAYLGCLVLAESLKCTSIAFPAISTGIYGFPAGRAAGIVRRVLEEFFSTGERSLQDVRLIFFKTGDMEEFAAGLEQA
ncbi:MAG TPA: O-acetyl-ADP-ribose deacetylase [Spirochaetota bacterium]|nr:O-acetyl-ADP-ribose deacetylase [Spirochaetota bacterium]HPN83380.1 O-acetyl-ADP-ribose deacetylase [Spirochaetota bacterium]